MRLNIVILASLLPGLGLARIAYGPGTLKKGSDTSPTPDQQPTTDSPQGIEGANLMETNSGTGEGSGTGAGSGTEGANLMETNTDTNSGNNKKGHKKTPPKSSGLKNDGARGAALGANKCGSSSFNAIPMPKDDMPLTKDCMQLRDNFKTGDHQWTVSDTREIMRYNTCGFYAKSDTGKGIVGNGDAEDLLTDTIKKFGDGKVMHGTKGDYKMYTGGGGAMACDDPKAKHEGDANLVYWAVVRTNREMMI